jgi:hypothetical protein
MSYLILAKSGRIVIQKSVWGISADDLALPSLRDKLASLANAIGDHIVDVNDIDEGDILQPNDDELDQYASEQIASLEYHDVTPEELDEYLHQKLLLPRGGELVTARVIKRTRDGDGVPVGTRHANPVLDSRKYEVEFDGGSVAV